MAYIASRVCSLALKSAPILLRSSIPKPTSARILPIFDTCKYTTESSNESATALKLSESCVKRLNEICNDGTYLRVLVDGGGCSGFQYKFELTSELNDDDVRLGDDGRVLIDTISLDYCAGATLDYQVELIKSGFRMLSNPKAEQGCSCGASFALKM